MYSNLLLRLLIPGRLYVIGLNLTRDIFLTIPIFLCTHIYGCSLLSVVQKGGEVAETSWEHHVTKNKKLSNEIPQINKTIFKGYQLLNAPENEHGIAVGAL